MTDSDSEEPGDTREREDSDDEGDGDHQVNGSSFYDFITKTLKYREYKTRLPQSENAGHAKQCTFTSNKCIFDPTKGADISEVASPKCIISTMPVSPPMCLPCNIVTKHVNETGEGTKSLGALKEINIVDTRHWRREEGDWIRIRSALDSGTLDSVGPPLNAPRNPDNRF